MKSQINTIYAIWLQAIVIVKFTRRAAILCTAFAFLSIAAQATVDVYIGSNTDNPSPPSSYTNFNSGVTYNQSTPTAPYNGTLQSDFDAIVSHFIWFQTNLTIHLTDGTFVTAGITNSHNGGGISFAIVGNDWNHTTIKLKDNATPSDFGSGLMVKNVIWFEQEGWTDSFAVQNLAIDCNWAGQTAYTNTTYTTGFKLGGLVGFCTQGYAGGVWVKNFGGNAGTPSTTKEVFPLILETVDLTNTTEHLIITSCQVSDFHRVHDAYCTAIDVVTQTGRSYSSPIAEINWCNVTNIDNGIAFGCSFSEGVVFQHNVASNAGEAFNCDSGPCRDISVLDNTFTTHYGINFGGHNMSATTPPYMDYITISGNSITTDGPITGYPYGYGYGVRLDGGCNHVTISGTTPSFSGSPSYDVGKVTGQTILNVTTSWSVQDPVPQYW